jgi:hypothetical protein
MDFPDLNERVAEVRGRIAQAVARGGHGQQVRLIAVTKTHGPEAVEAAWAAGVTDVGENKVQEALAKQDALADSAATRGGVQWHLIGHLQTNKAKALSRFALFHALDRDGLVDAARDAARKAGKSVEVLVQVNVSGEEQGRVRPPELAALAAAGGDAIAGRARRDDDGTVRCGGAGAPRGVRGSTCCSRRVPRRRTAGRGTLDGHVGRLRSGGGGGRDAGAARYDPFRGQGLTDLWNKTTHST